MTPSEYHQLRQYEKARQSRSALFTVFITIPVLAAAIVAAVVTLTWVAEGMRYPLVSAANNEPGGLGALTPSARTFCSDAKLIGAYVEKGNLTIDQLDELREHCREMRRNGSERVAVRAAELELKIHLACLTAAMHQQKHREGDKVEAGLTVTYANRIAAAVD